MTVRTSTRPAASHARRRRRGPVFWLAAFLASVLVVFVVVFGVTAIRVWQVGRQDHRPHSDALLVLGAAQYNGRPSATLQARLDHALELYDEHIAPRIITVGGNKPGDLYTEAGTGKTYLTEHGVPSSAIIAVPTGSDTLLSLQAAKKVFTANHWRSVVLVTDPWHSLRSRAMARDLGLTAQTSPTHTGPASHGRLTEGHYVVRESAGYLYYRATHGF